MPPPPVYKSTLALVYRAPALDSTASLSDTQPKPYSWGIGSKWKSYWKGKKFIILGAALPAVKLYYLQISENCLLCNIIYWVGYDFYALGSFSSFGLYTDGDDHDDDDDDDAAFSSYRWYTTCENWNAIAVAHALNPQEIGFIRLI